MSQAIPSYHRGETVTATATFTDPASGAGLDPSNVTLTVRKPDGTTTSPAVARTGAGQYTADFPTAGQPVGIYRLEWIGTGAGAVAPAAFEVLPSKVTP
jgi:uncharacterized protein YfaS (alpha-2-macroglobulin family)